MSAVIDLVLLAADATGAATAGWAHGEATAAPATPAALAQALAGLLDRRSPDAVLLWHRELGAPPDDDLVGDLLDQPDDVWHAGLALGTGAQPASLDLVAPTWMLTADPPADRPATSWRLSPFACLTRTSVLRTVGLPDPTFRSLTGTGLELGHRWVTHGALCRHEPRLLDPGARRPPLPAMPTEDQLRFVDRRFGTRWATYVALRWRQRRRGLRTVRRLRHEPRPTVADLPRAEPPDPGEASTPAVSVVVPTVDRYPWLRTLLDQLGQQSTAPTEVIVVDQTPVGRREDLTEGRGDLPLQVLTSEVAGQCTARNLALRAASGDLVLFLDDDDEIPPDLITRLAGRHRQLGVDAVSGVAPEPGETMADPAFRRFRQSDVFPTNNTLLARAALERSGLFDLAYDRGERADHDLGMRLYLGGARLVLDPTARVVHHHAPRGGLRTHAARVSTYRAARSSLTERHRLAPTEVYLWRRYHRPDQVREALVLRVLGTFSHRGTPWERLARAVVQAALLPGTVRQVRDAAAAADDLLATHPTIPPADGSPRR